MLRKALELRSSPTVHMSGAKMAAAGAAAVVIFGTSRLLVPSDRGDLAAAIAGANLAAAVASGSIWLGTSIELQRHHDMPSAARFFAVVYPTLLAVLALPMTVLLVGENWRAVAIWAVIAALVLTCYSLLQALALGSADIRGYAIAEVVRSWPSAILCVAVAAATRSVPWSMAAWAVGPVVGSIFLFVRAPVTRARMRLSRYLKVVGPQSLRAHGGNILGTLSLRFDIVLLVAISSTAEVAYYSLAVAFGEAMWILSSARGTLHLSEQIQGEPRRARAHAIRVLKRVMLLMVGLALVLELFGGFAVTLFAGHKYEPAIWPMRITVIGCGLFAVAHVVMPYLVAGLRRPGLLTGIGVLTVAVNFVLLLILGPAMGALGAAIASAVAYSVTAAVSLTLLLHPRFEVPVAPPVSVEDDELSSDSPSVLGGMVG